MKYKRILLVVLCCTMLFFIIPNDVHAVNNRVVNSVENDENLNRDENNSNDTTEPKCQDSKELLVGETYSIAIDNLQENAIVNYLPENQNSIISVSDKGVVKALKYGKSAVNIQVIQNDRQYSLKIIIYVYEAIEPKLDGNVYKIYSAPELCYISTLVSSGNTLADYVIQLQNDIDFDGPQWKCIGYNMKNFFAGTFDGQNHKLKNLNATGSMNSASILNAPKHTTGLFGVCIGATIKKLIIENANFSLSNESGYQNDYSSINGTCIYSGVVSGYAENCSFKNVIIKNSNITVYTGAESGYAYAGGVVGYAKQSDFIHCGNEDGVISGTSDSLQNDALVGGIIGELENDGIIRQSYNTSKIYGKASVSGAYTGGIVGKTTSNSNTLSSIRDCYNQGQIYHSGSWGETANVGGIIGFSSSTLNRCYNSGIVYANTNTVTTANLGGIAGSGISSSSVSNSAVMSSQITGGTSQYIISGAGLKENNIARDDLSITNDANSTYNINDFYGEKIYSDKLLWNFSRIWNSYNNKYPELKYIDSDYEKDIEIVDEAVKEVRILFAKDDNFSSVTNNIELKGATNGANVSWTSTNEKVVSSVTGVVSRQSEDYLVKVIANISSGDYSVKKTFVLNILGKDTVKNIETEEWGLPISSARAFVAYMRGCTINKVSLKDPDVMVLIGQDTDENHVISTLLNVMQYWEVPYESDYLKKKMGDIVWLIKSGEREVITSIVGNQVDDYINGVTNEKIVSKVFSVFFGNAYGSVVNYLTGYGKIENGTDYKFSEEGLVWKALKQGDTVGETITYLVKHGESGQSTESLTGGIITNYFK